LYSLDKARAQLSVSMLMLGSLLLTDALAIQSKFLLCRHSPLQQIWLHEGPHPRIDVIFPHGVEHFQRLEVDL
jgi:hypothetical protein